MDKKHRTPAKDHPHLSSTAQHIVIIFHDFSFGGTEVIALRLAAEWIRQGRRVTILCGTIDGPLRANVPVGVTVKTLEPEIGRSIFSRLRLRRLLGQAIERLKPDIVFLPGNFHLVLAGAVRGLANRPPVVAKISNPLAPATWRPLQWITQMAWRKVARDADWLIAMSSGLAQDARQILPEGRVEVVFDPNVDTRCATLTVKPKRDNTAPLHLVAAGRLVRQKDFALAVRMLAAMAKTRDVQLTIVGEGPERRKLERLAQRLGVAERLFLPGHVPSIVPALREADVLLVTSRYEGGPAVAIEALEQGVPVITTDCSHFLRDLLQEDAAGTIIGSRNPFELARSAGEWLDRQCQPFQPHPDILARFDVARVSLQYLQIFDRSVVTGGQASFPATHHSRVIVEDSRLSRFRR
jgi:glycosyltransferase involved in cell wall biosynthesis